MRYLALPALLFSAALALPSSAFAKRFAEFQYRIHLSVCGRGVVEGGPGEEGCQGDMLFASGTRRVELKQNDCTGEACDELGIFTGEYNETFRIPSPQVKGPYEVDLSISPAIFAFRNSTTYSLETHVSPVNGREGEDRLGYVSLKDPAGLNAQQVHGVARTMPGTKVETVKVSPVVFVSDFRIWSE